MEEILGKGLAHELVGQRAEQFEFPWLGEKRSESRGQTSNFYAR